MHLKVFLKLKNPKNFLFWVKKPPKNKKNKKPKKTKKPTGLVFFIKKPGFFPTLIWKECWIWRNFVFKVKKNNQLPIMTIVYYSNYYLFVIFLEK